MKVLPANLLLLFALTGSVHALAADAGTRGDEQTDTVAGPSLDQDTAADASGDDAGSEAAAEVADTDAEDAPPRNTNEPFVPSVQISEDLSVSFPVDI